MSGAPDGRFGHELDRTSTRDLEVLVLGAPDPTSRASLLERIATAAAEAPDRTAAVERTRREIAERMLVRHNAAGLFVTWAGIPWAAASSLRARDRAALVLAAQDAAVADLLADRLSPEDREGLRAGWDVAASMPGLGMNGAPVVRGPRAIVVGLALVAAVAIGAWPFLVVLAVQARRRPPDPHD